MHIGYFQHWDRSSKDVVFTCIINVGVNEVIAVFGNAAIARSPRHLAKDLDQLVTCNLVTREPLTWQRSGVTHMKWYGLVTMRNRVYDISLCYSTIIVLVFSKLYCMAAVQLLLANMWILYMKHSNIWTIACLAKDTSLLLYLLVYLFI